MSGAVSIRQRVEQLRKLQADLPDILSNAAKEATQRAVEATMDATPPKAGGDRLPGVNTVTGELKAHWETDSVTEPQKVGGGYVTFLPTTWNIRPMSTTAIGWTGTLCPASMWTKTAS